MAFCVSFLAFIVTPNNIYHNCFYKEEDKKKKKKIKLLPKFGSYRNMLNCPCKGFNVLDFFIYICSV